MPRLFEYLILRGLLFVGVPIVLFAMAVGPARCRAIVSRFWAQIWQRKQEPEEVIEQVVQQYRAMVGSLNQTLEKAHAADATLEPQHRAERGQSRHTRWRGPGGGQAGR